MSRRVRSWLTGTALVGMLLGLGLAYRDLVLRAPAGTFTWPRDGVTYELLDPRPLAVLLLAPLLIWVLGRTLADLPWQQRLLALGLRLAFLAVLGLGLARLVRTAESRRVATVFVVDVSDSVANDALEDARAAVARLATGRSTDDEVRLITFARRPRLLELPVQDGRVAVAPVEALRHGDPPEAGASEKPAAGSDLAAALRLAYGVLPPGYLRRIVLMSDGVETEGDVLAEANRARDLGVRLFTVPYQRPPPAEVAVRELRMPDKVAIGEPFRIIADVYASRASAARVRLFQGESLNGLDGAREVTLAPGTNELEFQSVVRVGGEVTYRLVLDRLARDQFTENNAYTVTLSVPGRPTVLYVEGQPQRASYLSGALTAQQFDVDVRSPLGFPGSLQELERFDFVILSDTPREAVGATAQELIARYVRDLGGGFLFAGGEAGFGLGGWAHSPIERILPVRMDAERRKEMPGVAMMLVIDRSGSMSGLPLEMAKAACKATVGTLQGDDLVGVIAFDSQPVRYVKLQPVRYRSRIQNDILRIQAGGGTEIFPALDLAYQDVSTVEARKKHVILLSDGRSPTQGLVDLVQAMIAESITVTTVGLGDGVDGELLRAVADTGGGRYHAVADPNALPRIFTRETEIVARQAAVEEWFPVQQVAPAAFLDGIAIASAPLLHGYVATQLKASPAQLILASDVGEPILARWRVGLGQTLAWTSDVKNRWAVDWLRWPSFGRFWGQLVREHMRRHDRRELPMKVAVVGGRLHAVVDAFTVDERFDNSLASTLSVMGPAPHGERREVPFAQTAPGRYEAWFPLDRYGSFRLEAQHRKEDRGGDLRVFAQSFGHVSHPYPREYASFEPDRPRLERVAAVGGGTVDPTPDALFAPGDERIVHHEELWDRFVLVAIVLFLLDLLVRRVRLFDRKFVPRRSARGAS